MRSALLLGCIVIVALRIPAEAQSTMNAIVVHQYGGPEVLKYEDAPRPAPKDNEMLVRVVAAGVNPVDGLVRSGLFAKYEKRTFPIILGADISGVVEKTGSRITKFKAGDTVYAYRHLKNSGGYAEYTLATESEASLKPASLTFEEAAAVPLAAETAWQALFDTAKLAAGQTLLIHGGSGGVGTFAIQFAKARGARVIATASTANQELLKELGADVPIDYSKTRFEDMAKGVDVVMDSVGKDTLARSYAVVKKGSFIASLVARPDPAELEKHGIHGGPMSVDPDANELAEITRLIEEKKVKVIVSQTYPLPYAAKAQEQAATGHTRGNLVLKSCRAAKVVSQK